MKERETGKKLSVRKQMEQKMMLHMVKRLERQQLITPEESLRLVSQIRKEGGQ